MRILCFIPFFNEEENLKNLIERINIHNYKIDEFLFVNSGSTDDSLNIVKKTNYKYLDLNGNKGLGYLFIKAINYAQTNNFDVLVVLSGNNKMNPKDFKTVLDPIINDNFDFIWGSRFLRKDTAIDTPKFREASIPILSKFISILFFRKITDATNGFRAFKISILSEVLEKYDRSWLYGYSFETYLFGLVLGNSKIKSKEVPVEIKYDKEQKHTKIRPVFDYPSIVMPFFYSRIKTLFK